MVRIDKLLRPPANITTLEANIRRLGVRAAHTGGDGQRLESECGEGGLRIASCILRRLSSCFLVPAIFIFGFVAWEDSWTLASHAKREKRLSTSDDGYLGWIVPEVLLANMEFAAEKFVGDLEVVAQLQHTLARGRETAMGLRAEMIIRVGLRINGRPGIRAVHT